MKSFFTKMLLSAAILFAGAMYGQTTTNVEELMQLAKQFNEENEAALERVKKYTEEHNVLATYTMPNGRYLEMVDVVDGKPVYNATESHGAAITTRASELWPGGSTGLNISGAGYTQLGQWDAGAPRVSHQEFTDQGPSRVSNMDGSGSHFHQPMLQALWCRQG